MTTPDFDRGLEKIREKIEAAFAEGADPEPAPVDRDPAPVASGSSAGSMASAMLGAYQAAATVNPGKAFKPGKAFAPQIHVDSPTEMTEKAWWDSVLSIVQVVAPVVIDAVSKDFESSSPTLQQILEALPPERRNDQDFADYATTVLLTLSEETVKAMSGQKDFTDPATEIPVPTPPSGKSKDWFDDVCNFAAQAAPVVLPIVMSLI
jgi:hypothetical protein